MDRVNVDFRGLLLLLFFGKLSGEFDYLKKMLLILALIGNEDEKEEESSTYAQQRYYDPETASFISEDPAKDSTNYYGYCGENPTAFVDPYGLYDNGTAREGSNSKSNRGDWTRDPATKDYLNDPRGSEMAQRELDFRMNNPQLREYEATKNMFKNAFKNAINENPDAITYITNGTNVVGKTLPNDVLDALADVYFLTSNNEMNSEEAAKEIAAILGSKKGVFLGWEGKNNHSNREEAAKQFVERIKADAEKYMKETGKNLNINLVGHSHGGNVMIMVANMLIGVPVNIDNLLTLNTPVRQEYQLNSPVNHIQLYSNLDMVQNIGYIDDAGMPFAIMGAFSVIGIPSVIAGIGRHQFISAKNIDITSYITQEVKNIYNNIIYSTVNDAHVIYHQATRIPNVIRNALKGGQ